MLTSWRERLQQFPELTDINNWPKVDTDSISKSKRRTFRRNINIVVSVLEGESCSTAAKKIGVSPAMVTNVLNRCLGGQSSEQPILTYACIPFTQVNGSLRIKPHTDMSQNSGFMGEFKMLLTSEPIIEETLSKFIRNKLSDRNTAHTLNPAALHAEFKRILNAIHWPRTSYPFNTDSVAYHSVYRFYKEKLLNYQLKQFQKPFTHIAPKTKIGATPLREVEIDEQLIDVSIAIEIEFADKLITLRLPRIAAIVAVDKDTNCVIAYHLCLTAHPSKEEMLQLLQKLVKGQEQIDIITHGFVDQQSCNFPSVSSPDGTLHGIHYIKLDNALCHLADDVRHAAVSMLGATLSFGKKASPKSRNWVEAAMKIINGATHRFASTSGSHPKDPIKESSNNRKTPPKLTLHTLQEALHLVFGQHNNTPKGSLASLTPIEAFEKFTANSFGRIVSIESVQNLKLLNITKYCCVKFYPHENRMPFVNYIKIRYSGSCLARKDLVGQKVKLQIDLLDARYIRAYSLKGEYLGLLNAPKSWLRFKHSYHLRKLILRLVRKHTFSRYDPLIGYFDYLVNNIQKPKYALRLARLVESASYYGPLDELTSSTEDITKSSRNEVEVSIQSESPSSISPIRDWDESWITKNG
jgi:putative transposase